MLVPEIEMSPVSKETSPNIALIRVDLPDPTGPVMMVVVEAFSWRLISVIANSAVSEGLAVRSVTTIAG
jgi:hypothetical protein